MKELSLSMWLPPAQSRLIASFVPNQNYQCYTDTQGMRILRVTISANPVEAAVFNLKKQSTLFYKLDKLELSAPSQN
jgi:hypothetical protein